MTKSDKYFFILIKCHLFHTEISEKIYCLLDNEISQDLSCHVIKVCHVMQ